MLVSYEKTNTLAIPVMSKNNKEAIAKTIRLVPGINQVDDDDWKSVSTHPRVKALVKESKIVVMLVTPQSDEKTGEQVDNLSSMDVKTCATIIGKTLSIPLLEEWSSTEKRDSVLKMITTQIKKIEETTKKED